MNIELVNMDEFTDINHIQPVSSPVLFQRGDRPHPNGLLSLELFGVTPKARKETFGYIDVGEFFFHPHVYKIIKRFFRGIEGILNGTEYFIIDSSGHLIKSDEEFGSTGVSFLYNNWEKIKWERGESSARNERIDVIVNSKKAQIFLDKMIVIPAFYRDVTSSRGSGGSTKEINTLYSKLIRISSILTERDSLGFPLYHTQAIVQNLLVEIYDYFKDKLESKNGLLRKYLMGKNTDFCTRTVITGPVFHADKPEDMDVDLEYTAVPVPQILALCKPFIMTWVKSFFERELFTVKDSKNVLNPVTGQLVASEELNSPESTFTDKFIKKKMDSYIKDPDGRFDPIEIPLKNGKISYMAFHGRKFSAASKDEMATISTRKMTWTDLFYMAAEDTTRDKHVLITRYPLLDQYGLFISKIRPVATAKTTPMQVGERVYPFYPVVDFTVRRSKVAAKFVDSVRFSNSFLPGIDGDYDGDQTTCKVMWTQESNEECEEKMNAKSFFLNTNGILIRKVELEAIQTFYNLTKNTNDTFRTLSESERLDVIHLSPSDLTFTKLINMFATLHDPVTKKEIHKFYPEDRMVLKPGDWFDNKEPIDTTVGRFVFNKLMVEKIGFEKILDYANYEVTEGKFFKNFEQVIADALLLDKITVPQLYSYVNTRDWLGMQLHALITPSFTENTFRIAPEVKKLKEELFETHAKELDDGNAVVAAQIENQLIAKTKEVLKGDPGMDLYNSGARGSLSNNYKNMFLMRGAVYNRAKKKYEVVKNALNDGLAIRDIPVSANTILEGAYPKAVGTRESGYIAKQLLASCQSEILGDRGSDCGSKRGIETTITSGDLYRYIFDGGKTILLTDDNISKYLGKKVQLRSPMSCIRTDTGCICNKCGGEFYYMIDNESIGLSASKIGNSLTRLNMKKFHENVIKFSEIDVNDMFF